MSNIEVEHLEWLDFDIHSKFKIQYLLAFVDENAKEKNRDLAPLIGDSIHSHAVGDHGAGDQPVSCSIRLTSTSASISSIGRRSGTCE